MQAAVERLLHHRRVQLRGRRDDERVEPLAVEHAIEVGVALEARVLAQDVGEVGGRVAAGDEIELGMGADDGEMG